MSIHTLIIRGFFVLLMSAPPVWGAGDPGSGPSGDALEPAIDAVMTDRLRADGIPGGVLVIVRDGRVLLAKGYGLADVEGRRPMTADTLLPVASVSKVFTATAVMQQVERGRLRLDADVNEYLREFQIPEAFGEPVRVWHLLTHTSGFDSLAFDMSAPSADAIQPLARYLAANIPPRLVAPGRIALYSNYGIALAGHLVENVSGLRFTEYVHRHILQPLAMTQSSFVWRDEMEPRSATGYRMRAGQMGRAPHIRFLNVAPAASLITTGHDIGRFLIAHLEEATPDGGRLFSRETARLMHARRFSQHPAAGSMASGFFDRVRNGRRTLMHDGDWAGYSARLLLVPEERLGIFVAFNRWHEAARAKVVQAVLDRLMPAPSAPMKLAGAAPPADGEARDLAGVYRWNRYSHESPLTLASLPPEVTVVAVAGDTLRLGPAGPEFRAIQPLVYERSDRNGRLAFIRNPAGAITHMVVETPEASGFTLLERVPWHRRATLHKAVRWSVVALAASVLMWPLGALVRYLRSSDFWRDRLWRRAYLWALLAGVLVVAFQLGLRLALADLLARHGGALARAILLLPAVTVVLLPILLYYTYRVWTSYPHRLRTWFAQIHYAAVTSAVLIHVVWANYWNLLLDAF